MRDRSARVPKPRPSVFGPRDDPGAVVRDGGAEDVILRGGN